MPDDDLPKYFDRDGHRISYETYGRLRLDRGYRSVAETIEHRYRVSTIWLGKDPRPDLCSDPGNGPRLFETLIFTPQGIVNSVIHTPYLCWYPTELEALAGHYEALRWLRVRRAVAN
ncbi:hypothetical protein AB0L82_35780 [Nocardia sp. NPDC052001]|uniref:hypothetical protein n=1 Tax=Nocardia sp. NPDC052001 TaxID=3154853 RepID=UPI00341CED27